MSGVTAEERKAWRDYHPTTLRAIHEALANAGFAGVFEAVLQDLEAAEAQRDEALRALEEAKPALMLYAQSDREPYSDEALRLAAKIVQGIVGAQKLDAAFDEAALAMLIAANIDPLVKALIEATKKRGRAHRRVLE